MLICRAPFIYGQGLPTSDAALAKLDPLQPPISYPVANPEQDALIHAALNKKVSFDWKNVPLKDVVSQLADATNIILVLTKKIEDAGVRPDQPITKKFVNSSLRSVLIIVLSDLNLTYLIKDEAVKITTVADAQSPDNLSIRLYPVKDLVTVVKGKEITMDFDPLIDLVTCLQPDTWYDVGGPGNVNGSDDAACLIISQRDDGHEVIGRLLITLRRVKAVQGITVPGLPAANRYVLPGKSAAQAK